MNSSASYKFLLAGIFLCFSSSASAVSVTWGALAFSSITECQDALCSTQITTSEQDGDDNVASSVQTDLNLSGSRAFAQATLSGTALTPTLGVLADSTSSSAFPNLVLGSASGVQGYTNNGPATTIVFDLILSADYVTGIGAPNIISVGSVNAFAAVFRNATSLDVTEDSLGTILLGGGFTNDPDGDISGAGLLNSPAGGPPPAAIPVQTSTFSFDVDAGESFLLWAGLQAVGSFGGIADARNTLTVDLRDADTLDLDIASNMSVIPLPAGAWLFLSGIGLVAGLSRRRKLSEAS